MTPDVVASLVVVCCCQLKQLVVINIFFSCKDLGRLYQIVPPPFSRIMLERFKKELNSKLWEECIQTFSDYVSGIFISCSDQIVQPRIIIGQLIQ